MNYWKGPVTFTKQQNKDSFDLLSWVARAASKVVTRFYTVGVFNELLGDDRIFVSTDQRQMHIVKCNGNPPMFADVPIGKNLAFTADSKQFVFTQEIDGVFPNYKAVIPSIEGINPFEVFMSKPDGYTEALYELYSRKICVSAPRVAAFDRAGCPAWKIYHVPLKAVLCTQETPTAVYTSIIALIST